MKHYSHRAAGSAATMSLACVLSLGSAISSRGANERPTRLPALATVAAPQENPDLLSFDELAFLASTAKPDGTVAARLDALLHTPFVHRETPAGDAQPRRPNVQGLGP